MRRTTTISTEEVLEAEATMASLNTARDAIEDLRHKLRSRGDDERAGMLVLALIRLGEAEHRVKETFT